MTTRMTHQHLLRMEAQQHLIWQQGQHINIFVEMEAHPDPMTTNRTWLDLAATSWAIKTRSKTRQSKTKPTSVSTQTSQQGVDSDDNNDDDAKAAKRHCIWRPVLTPPVSIDQVKDNTSIRVFEKCSEKGKRTNYKSIQHGNTRKILRTNQRFNSHWCCMMEW